MTRKYFGTDGIRGRVGEEPLTAEFALRLASAAARVLAPNGGKVAIGKDTRVSGYMFESALEAGFVAAGMDVLLLGPLPTPGIAYLTQELKADLGVVISASHNLYYDNGIKFFDRNGGKLSDEVELAIEASLKDPAITRSSESLGRAKRVDNARQLYQQFCLSTLPDGITLEGLKVVIDGSHGAGYKIAPRVLNDLGADIIPIGCSPNGRNINDGCGSTQPELLQHTVTGVGADLGIALDGDGDRLVMVTNEGELVDGDQLIYAMAMHRHREGKLSGPVVGTLMSNLGLQQSLEGQGIEFHRAQVGDRYVREMLIEKGGHVGGESSGHLLCLDTTTTGDGLIAALQMLSIMQATGSSLKDLVGGMHRYPQTLVNVRTPDKVDLGAAAIQDAVTAVESRLGDGGRVVLRASGTEPVVRVMVEGDDENETRNLAETIADAVRETAGA